jgi:hypothetical protein
MLQARHNMVLAAVRMCFPESAYFFADVSIANIYGTNS